MSNMICVSEDNFCGKCICRGTHEQNGNCHRGYNLCGGCFSIEDIERRIKELSVLKPGDTIFIEYCNRLRRATVISVHPNGFSIDDDKSPFFKNYGIRKVGDFYGNGLQYAYPANDELNKRYEDQQLMDYVETFPFESLTIESVRKLAPFLKRLSIEP